MRGQTVVGTGGLNSAASRMFRYEVVGLRQNQGTDRNKYPIRNSGSVFITVPYDRMNDEMQRISRLGGRIVNIEPMTAESALKPDSESQGKAAKAKKSE
ncbi:phycobilisome linker polypeptide [Desertifilum sp. FACHB-1129]|uniref:Phycobilisome linker polypeptide n=2 Tax=Desertifilum tharense IPPAS B-1220 TaxID=1781255 RepID=A0A1E5QEJ7_9CYAN|nr:MULTISPECIES: phycobilisome linker polypeptide [Desertifilum]MDA0212641.1 phycobilisome linker polypeptide [Cyanobacteria bacterium FC1]MBD2313128.1 phycobilisome linker polypeptide [Desertifilum sp. FACHB-1129]MBD2324066.1 phycobilisome linker polypeptide [Desertifilum sp. FACHB-866]MBD2334001.1 phycobilisome linker polypeptide [Desertifilum sp. FACHB-868]OEJ73092.1 phycobilisome linker polypeptide [Desertifilum tharense IPPAS B-1220]